MADIRNPFATLEDASNVGQVMRAVQEGEAVASKNGSLGFAFKDSSGNAIAPALSAAGKIMVDTGSAGNLLKSRIENATGSTSVVTLSSITLTASTVYQDIDFICSSRTAGLFQVIWSDNGAETVLADVVLDSGQYTYGDELPNVQFTSGATGPQLLIIKANNFSKASALRSTLSVLEVV